MELSEIFINLRFQSVANWVLALLIIVLQLVSSTAYPEDAYERVGAGFWTGIVFGITGFITWRSIDNYRYSRASLILAYLSISCGVILIGVYSASLAHIDGSCSSHGSSLCAKHMTLDVFLLICGLLVTVLNILLAYSARLFLLSC